MTPSKKPYVAPSVTAYGAVRDLTRNAGQPNSDVPRGADGTAFSPG